jgi:hypothetical protein
MDCVDLAGNLVPVKFPASQHQGGCLPTGLSVLNKDIAFGTQYEIPIIARLERLFGETILKAEDRYSLFDAYSEKTKYEIKSRRNKYADYPTTIVAVDKTKTAGRLVFVFHFLDGLYYIEFNKERWAKYEIKNVSAFRSGGNRTDKPHFFIDIKDLTEIRI